MLYFAYGSNLNHFQMKRRCKDSIFIKKYELKDYTLFAVKDGTVQFETDKSTKFVSVC